MVMSADDPQMYIQTGSLLEALLMADESRAKPLDKTNDSSQHDIGSSMILV